MLILFSGEVREACFNNALSMILYYKMTGYSPNIQEVDAAWSLSFVTSESSSNSHDNGMSRDSCEEMRACLNLR